MHEEKCRYLHESEPTRDMISQAKIRSLEHESKDRSAAAKGKTPKTVGTYTADSDLLDDNGRKGKSSNKGKAKGDGKAKGKGLGDHQNMKGQPLNWGKWTPTGGKAPEVDLGKSAKMLRTDLDKGKGYYPDNAAKGKAQGEADATQDHGKGKKGQA